MGLTVGYFVVNTLFTMTKDLSVPIPEKLARITRKCFRCMAEWRPRVADIVKCPRCHSPLFRVRRIGQNKFREKVSQRARHDLHEC